MSSSNVTCVIALICLFLPFWCQHTLRNLRAGLALQTLCVLISMMSSIPTYIKTKPTSLQFSAKQMRDDTFIAQVVCLFTWNLLWFIIGSMQWFADLWNTVNLWLTLQSGGGKRLLAIFNDHKKNKQQLKKSLQIMESTYLSSLT